MRYTDASTVGIFIFSVCYLGFFAVCGTGKKNRSMKLYSEIFEMQMRANNIIHKSNIMVTFNVDQLRAIITSSTKMLRVIVIYHITLYNIRQS